MEGFAESRLDNGLTVVTYRIPYVRSAAVGMWVAAGGRYEDEEICGISHFLEHMLFKGTGKRSARQIKEEIEGRGGRLNGFTDNECTCYYAWVVEDKLVDALDVLSDMVLDPALQEEDIDKERGVIHEEIRMNYDIPMRYVSILFGQVLFPDHPLGNPLVGTHENIDKFTREDFRAYMRKRYTPDNIVVAVAGKIEHEQVVEQVGRFFEGRSDKGEHGFLPVDEEKESTPYLVKSQPVEQVHMCIGMRGYDRKHPARYALTILNVILGGNMSSRLFEEIRDKRGLAYYIGSNAYFLADTGIFKVAEGVDPKRAREALRVTLEEMRKLKEEVVGEEELVRAKEFAKGQLILGLEDPVRWMIHLGEQRLCLGWVENVESIMEGIDKVTQDDILHVAQDIFRDEKLRLAVVGPVDEGEIVEELHF